MGLKKSALNWISSFLLDITYQVRFGNSLSSVERLTSGVAKSSVYWAQISLIWWQIYFIAAHDSLMLYMQMTLNL